MSEAPCVLAMAPLISSLVRDVLFSDVLSLLVTTVVTIQDVLRKVLGVGVGGVGREQVEGMLAPLQRKYDTSMVSFIPGSD